MLPFLIWTRYALNNAFLVQSSKVMKSLDSLLRSLRLQSQLQNRVVLNEPWGVAFPARRRGGTFHFIEEGNSILNVAGEAIPMTKGDFVLVLWEGGHSVQDVMGTEPTDVVKLVAEANLLCESGLTLQFGGDGPLTSVISGKFTFEDADTHPLWRSLPPYILLKGSEGRSVDWLETTLNFLADEATSVRPGVTAILDRLCDVLFIQTLRGWVQRDEAVQGWPAAVRDPAMDQVLDLIHRQPAEAWTLASLADRVAMSRSSFAERFRRLLGESPMVYLARWRMHQAAGLLREGRDPVAAIAERVGYESEAAFAKAFKREVGVSPGAYRRSLVQV